MEQIEIDINITKKQAIIDYVTANHDASATYNDNEKDLHEYYKNLAKAYWSFIWKKYGIKADEMDRNCWIKYIGKMEADNG